MLDQSFFTKIFWMVNYIEMPRKMNSIKISKEYYFKITVFFIQKLNSANYTIFSQDSIIRTTAILKRLKVTQILSLTNMKLQQNLSKVQLVTQTSPILKISRL